ncbi:MAG: threonine--tRNA ligase [Candidatus Aminicenantes bacterium]|jgi:threonyl-tRNA synthetase
MSQSVQITLEGSFYSVKEGTSLKDVLSEQELKRPPLLARMNGHMKDLRTKLTEDADIQLVYEGDADALPILRHSAAHLLAHAVMELFPGTQIGIGPDIENGYYYDFLREEPFTLDDLSAIEDKMKELARQDVPIERVVLNKDEAIKMFKDLGQKLKVELIEEKGDDEVTCYRQGDFIDFCLGPHVPSSGYIKHFKLLSVSGAYWKGDENGIQLQRIYGTAFFTRKGLKDYLNLVEEAKKRDHRKLGPELDLFSFNESLGAGLILWHPKGAAVRRAIEDYWYEEHFQAGYEILNTPHVAKLDVWHTSGHTEFYDALYPPLLSEGIEYELKPMNCPFHIMVYKTKSRSYRELPFRWAELGTVYRYERSGVLHGLLRVRGFTQDDAHIFCRTDQLEEEIKDVVKLALKMLGTFGFTEYKLFLSTCPEKFCGMEKDWQDAEASLERALRGLGQSFQVDEGEGVFYGPKIDIKVKDALQRSWQLTTCQLDFNLSERFDLSYVGEDGKFHRPYLVHRALLGSLERFFGILIEHYNGNFPLWLAPVQIVTIPIADRHNDYARSLDALFRKNRIRSSMDVRREKVGYKIRDAETSKIPLILIVGDKEVEHNSASLRVHGEGDKGEIRLNEFLEKVKELIKNRLLSVTF